MITRVTQTLAESGVALSQEELLDALWLAGRLPRGAGPLARLAAPEAPRGPTDAPSPAAPGPDGVEISHELPTAGQPDPDSAHPVLATAEPVPEAETDTPKVPVLPVRAPDGRAVGAGELGLGKALRPIRQRFPDHRNHELDIARTVTALADTGMPEIVTHPARSRWLSLALVVDDGVSMVLWQRLAAELRTLMERAGAFRDVHVHGLDSRGSTPRLRTSPYAATGRLRAPETVSDPTGNTLVLVVSDGVGEAWRDGSMRRVMELWTRCGPTAIVQTLPTRLWDGSGIAARPWQVTTRRRGGPSRAWHITDPVLPPDLVSFDSVPVPVLEPTPVAIGDWARIIASPSGTAVLPLWSTNRSRADRPVAGASPGDDAEVVLRFRAAASPEAYRLAAHLAAVSPVTPPVMRLTQAALGPPTDPGHITEVFLGGLMHQLATDDPDSPPHHRRYDFSSDARRVLLAAVSPKDLLRVTGAVTEHIEAAVGRSPVFPAWVGHPDGSAVVGDAGRSFGWLREELLRRLGIEPGVVGTGPGTAGAGPTPATLPGTESGLFGTEAEPLLPRPDELPSGWEPLLTDDPGRFGRFRPYARSARGWFHVVMYLALDEDGTTVTVRAPAPEYGGGMEAGGDLVRTEAECLLRMGGTYAPELLDVRTSPAHVQPWIAAAFVHRGAENPSSGPAPNLRAFLEECGGSVPEEAFLRIGQDLARAVDRAHGLGLVHGGLAPRAVLVTNRDVRLVGWMAASIDGADSDHSAGFPRSDAYVGPDEGGSSPTPESDVAAVGALLLSLLTGGWSDPRTSEGRRTVAASRIAPELVDTLWRCLEKEPNRRPSAATLAAAFTRASARQAVPGAGEDAVRPVAELEGAAYSVAADNVRRYRALARQEPNAHAFHLARSLRILSNRLADDGRLDEALMTVDEAVQLFRQQYERSPEVVAPDLAETLGNQSVRLSAVGRAAEALIVGYEAVSLYRPLAQREPEAYGPGLAALTNNLSNRLADVDRPREALDAIEEAVRINRELADLHAGAHETVLARSLTNLGNRLGGLGRRREGLRAAEEAVLLYRSLAAHRSADVGADLATSLNNLAVRLADVGRRQEAFDALEEAAEAGRRFADGRSEAFREANRQGGRIRSWILETPVGRQR
ncbi:protein kinase family protein [Streptomyces sp. WY228]|uniref:protein kinase family protein n=1 Tax=Streptomyces sp. WY228 TaxID=2855836 RepID=UPI001C4F3506|nr:protein kinase family protein [Streptomyces sp. WY228]QXQ95490.1 tetratricopeptide repeat protein [Streptomyces sp. WY228]